jgi:hypothetical protein
VTLAILPVIADANPCGPPGQTQSFRQNNQQGYFLQKNVARRSLFLAFPGQAFQIDRNAPAYTNAFTLDGIYYQSLTTPTESFKRGKGPVSVSGILARHAKWEFDAARISPTPLKQFEDLGNAPREASSGTPELTFKMWRLYNEPKNGPSQYFLTTVVDDEVIVLSAVVPSPAAAAAFFRVSREYTSRFRYLRNNECQGDQNSCPGAGARR